MPRNKNPNRIIAFKIYKESQGKITIKEIAIRLSEKPRNITYWKKEDEWDKKYNPKGGAPIGNQNAIGNKGGAASIGNQNARVDGWYSKYFPIESKNIIKELQDSNASSLDILWAQIVTQWTAIIRAQKIMHIKDKKDITKELKKEVIGEKIESTEYEIQFAWDKHANFLNAQSRAMTTLTNIIKKYDEMIHANWDITTEEQRLRVEKIKIQIENPSLIHKKEVSKEKLKIEKEILELRKKESEAKVF